MNLLTITQIYWSEDMQPKQIQKMFILKHHLKSLNVLKSGCIMMKRNYEFFLIISFITGKAEERQVINVKVKSHRDI